jgi:predicted ribosome quality control (RQC) complex YloA/Tae2 family protein
MVKTRFSALDCKALVRDLSATAIGMRCANVYDLDAKTYLFKLALPDKPKKMLIVESGVRFHTTQFEREKSPIPSGFAMKMRKHIRTRRLESVRQVGMDRVVDLKFGIGEIAHHVIVELYASGNIVLTDYKYEILAVLRTHSYDDTVKVAVHQIYPMLQAAELEANDSLFATADQSATEGASPVAEGAATGEGAEEGSAKSEGMGPLSTLTACTLQTWLAAQLVFEAEKEKAKASLAAAQQDTGGKQVGKKRAKQGKQQQITIKKCLSGRSSGKEVHTLGPVLLEHALSIAGVPSNTPLVADDSGSVLSPVQAEALVRELKRAALILKRLGARDADGNVSGGADQVGGDIVVEPADDWGAAALDSASDSTGYIIVEMKAPKSKKANLGVIAAGNTAGGKAQAGTPQSEVDDTAGLRVYVDFTPVLLAQHQGKTTIRFENFDLAVDEFFSKIETQRAEQQVAQFEQAALVKQDTILREQSKRVTALEDQQQARVRQATMLQHHTEAVENALLVVRSALANGMGWDELEALVKAEQKNGNPVAMLISRLKLEQNKVELVLEDPWMEGGEEDERVEEAEEAEEEDEKKKTKGKTKKKKKKSKSNATSLDSRWVKVDVDLGLSAQANASALYTAKKAMASKVEKTKEATEKAMEVAMHKSAAKLAKQQRVGPSIKQTRKIFWFERFNWFITSENYLVISGRDAQQNEMIVKRYMRKWDAYIHADLHGASTCILRNRYPGRELSEIALMEAGHMAVCRSSAWDSRMVTSAWWVKPDQVSKTAPTGEYLSTGSFMVRGRKTFLPPVRLEMGFGLLFWLDEESTAAHKGERKLRGLEDEDEDEEAGAMQGGGGDKEDGTTRLRKFERAKLKKEAMEATEEAAVEEGQSEGREDNEGSATRDSKAVTENCDTVADSVAVADDSADADAAAAAADDDDDAAADAAADAVLSEKREAMDTTADDADPDGGGNQSESAEGGDGSSKSRIGSGMSTKQRKLLKKLRAKGLSGDELEAAMVEAEAEAAKAAAERKEKEEAKAAAAAAESMQELQHQKQQVRGKKGKLKKLKAKYAEQDEDERRLAMQALGSAGNSGKEARKKDKKGKGSKTKGREGKEAAIINEGGEVALAATEQQAALVEAAKRAAKEEEAAFHRSRQEWADNSRGEHSGAPAGIEGVSKKERQREEKRKEAEEIKAVMADEGLANDDEEEGEEDKEATNAEDREHDRLTGIPKEPDLLHFAIPMCAPYSAMQNYKYKVKLTPGAQKKGKASKQAMEIFYRLKDSPPQEMALLKQVSDADLVATIMSGVSISAAGLSQIRKNQKQNKKAKKKKGK